MKNLLLCLGILMACMSACQDSDESSSNDATSPSQSTETITQAPPTSQGPLPITDRKVVLFFGNSLTAGYGLSPEQAFPALVQQKIDSAGLDYEVINAGLSGETTASGLNRLDWVMTEQVDVFVLELGANDGLRGIDTEETRKNLIAIIQKVREKSPHANIVLAGMMVPPNMGEDYAAKFRFLYPELASQYQLALVPFLLDGVAGNPDLNLPDGIHPTPEGHQIVAKNVWTILAGLL
ncbi:arylesterase [Pontibacter sp. G13]|uniref:arylesterase n=1 Tax=Pontibacter sp. G13 TaxID=3074898 RepID=UPI00288B68BF|nr:arylesterase [Pontibacter sp. G13]WNJ17184.1 arylesterase [Pontibacter sp. G13]